MAVDSNYKNGDVALSTLNADGTGRPAALQAFSAYHQHTQKDLKHM